MLLARSRRITAYVSNMLAHTPAVGDLANNRPMHKTRVQAPHSLRIGHNIAWHAAAAW